MVKTWRCTIEAKIISVKQRGGFTLEDADGCEYFMPLALNLHENYWCYWKNSKSKVIKVK